MTVDTFAARAAAYLRRRGLTGATATPDGRITGLPGVRAAVVGLQDTEHADMELLMSAAGLTMPYAVVQERPGYPASAGYVTLSVGGFARLLGAPDDTEATARELAAVFTTVVAVLTSYDGGNIIPVQELVAGVDAVGVVEALAVLYCALARAMLPAAVRDAVMQHLGLAAALSGEA